MSAAARSEGAGVAGAVSAGTNELAIGIGAGDGVGAGPDCGRDAIADLLGGFVASRI